jgi:hypothetical protein
MHKKILEHAAKCCRASIPIAELRNERRGRNLEINKLT